MANEDKAVIEWLDSMKGKGSKVVYQSNWNVWLEYCKAKGLPKSGSEQLEDMKQRRLSTDNTVKYFYDNEVVKLFKWLQTEYISPKKHKPLTENSALHVVNAVRSFFKNYRYSLEVQKDKLPTSEKVSQTYIDHAFDIYQLVS